MNTLPVTSLFAAVALLAAPSSATGEETRSLPVNLAGVDLASEVGAGHALRRIERAAERVCEARDGRQPHDVRLAARACVREAVARAVRDLDAPLVSVRLAASTQLARTSQRR